MSDAFSQLGTIWLIGGTQESAQLARAIASLPIRCIVSVTTESARQLYPVSPSVQVQVTRFETDSLAQFLSSAPIRAIVDASHPYAVAISELAIAASAQFHIPYLRYERPLLESLSSLDDPVIVIESLEDFLNTEKLVGQRVLLTLGYRMLSLFQAWQARAVLFARILPSQTALEAAFHAGFTSDRLIALRPPLSLELERALWQHWQISMVITKASGTPGGEDLKQQLAQELGVTLVKIARPTLDYPQQTRDLQEVLDFCCTHLLHRT